MVSSSIRLTAWLQNSAKGRNGQRDWCTSRVTAIIPFAICIIVCLSWAVNCYRDNAITYKAQRDKKMPENWSWRTRQLLTCRCVSVMPLRLDAKYTKELADAKAENDALRDDVAAGRRRLHIKAVCRRVKPPAASAWIMQPSDWQTPLNGIILTSERGWSAMQKQLEGTQKYINEQCRGERSPYRWATHAIIVSTYTRFQWSITSK